MGISNQIIYFRGKKKTLMELRYHDEYWVQRRLAIQLSQAEAIKPGTIHKYFV